MSKRSPSVTNGKSSSSESSPKTVEEAVERGELSADLRELFDSLTPDTTERLLDAEVESVDDIPDELLAELDEVPDQELRELPDDVLDELPDDVTSSLEYDTDYSEYVDDDIDWSQSDTREAEPHPESARAQQLERLDEAREQDSRPDLVESRSPSDSGVPEDVEGSLGGADYDGEMQTLAEAEPTQSGEEVSAEDVEEALDSEGQPLDASASDPQNTGDQDPLDAAQAGQTEDFGAKNAYHDTADVGGSVQMGPDAAGSRLQDMVGETMPDHVRTASGQAVGELDVPRDMRSFDVMDADPAVSDYVDTTTGRDPLSPDEIQEAVESGRALPRPAGADAWGVASISGREASIEQTRQTVFDIANEEFDDVGAKHLDQLSETQRDAVAEKVAAKYSKIRDDVTDSSQWTPRGFQYEAEISGAHRRDPPSDDTARWFQQHRELADFEPARTETPTSDDVQLVADLLGTEEKAELTRESASISDDPNVPDSGDVYERMLTAVAAGAEPDEAADMVKRDVRSYTVSESGIGSDPAATPAFEDEIGALQEKGIEKTVVEGVVTESREPKKSSQFQYCRLNGEVNLHLWENSGAEKKVAPGDRVRITHAAIGDHDGYKQVSDTGASEIEILEESDTHSRSEVAPEGRSRASPDWEGTPTSTNTAAALGADSPRTSRSSDDGGATTISRVDQSGADSKTATVRHTGDREETKPWEKKLYNTSWWEDQEWSRPHEHTSDVPDSSNAEGFLGDYEPSVSDPFHHCGTLATINMNGEAYCPNCEARDHERTDFPDIESGFEQYGHGEPKVFDETGDTLSVSDVDADI